jgi:hypothetical protein
MIKIIYNSPAMPQEPYNVALGVSYECEKSKGKYVVQGVNFKKEFTLEVIKMLFKPCDGYSWDMLEETKESKIDTEEKATKKVAKSVKK